jgi:DNA-binding MarR family transcriptional regulator
MGPDKSMFAILEVAHSIRGRLAGALDEVGLSHAKFAALEALAGAGEPLPLSELANRLECVRSNVTQLVDRLEADGLVQRVSDPTDRRSVRAELTRLGAERQAAGADVMARLHAELESRVEPAERALLQRVLAALG